MNRLPLSQRATIVRLLVEGSSLRSISRITGVSINTATKLLVDVGEACHAYHNEHVRGVRSERIQVDELWSFCYAKEANVGTAKRAPEGAGDVWTWTAIDADTKLIVSWLIGPRDEWSARMVMADLAARVEGRPQITTDGLSVYPEAVRRAFGGRAHYASLVKDVGADGVCRGTAKTAHQGDPDPRYISTSLVERHNLTIRMSVKRYARRSNAYSKKLANHGHHLAIYTAWFNYCRIHGALRMSPAMAAGLTMTLRDADWIADLADRN